MQGVQGTRVRSIGPLRSTPHFFGESCTLQMVPTRWPSFSSRNQLQRDLRAFARHLPGRQIISGAFDFDGLLHAPSDSADIDRIGEPGPFARQVFAGSGHAGKQGNRRIFIGVSVFYLQ